MQCSCGGVMVKRNVVRKKIVVGTMMVCKATRCGRVEKSLALIKYLETNSADDLKDIAAT